MKIVILTQDRESETFITPFSSTKLAIQFALDEIKEFDKCDGVVEECEDYIVVSSDGCENPYIIQTHTMDIKFKS